MKTEAMKLFRAQLVLGLIVIFVCSCQTGSEPTARAPVRIDAGMSEEKIRAELLKYTPIGAMETDVMEFARTRLRHGNVGLSYDRPNNVIVLLGRYGFSLIGSKDTWVQWRFDENHRLVEIYVEREHDAL